MATVRPTSDWKPLWYFPWVKRRMVGLYLDTDPNVPVDVNAFWYEYRWAI